MPANLVLIPDLAVAFQHINNQIDNCKSNKTLSTAYVLMPTTAAISSARWQLQSSLGVRMVQFYGLGEIILEAARAPIQRLSDISIRRLVGRLLWDLFSEGSLTTFASVWNKPGFTQVLIEWLREVKSQGISPEEVQMHADQSQSERDQQLAKLYQRYQDFLHDTNTSDADGLLWLAAERLEGDVDLLSSDEPFFILGFDHFNPLQVRILEQIAKRRRAFFIYLLWDQERSRDSLALYRLSRTRSTLERSLSPQVVYWEGVGRQPSSIRHVSETLFELQPPPYQADQSLATIAAPSREAEVRYAVREIKELLLSGVLPHQIGLLVTDKPVYLPIIQAVSREYGVPIQVEGQLHDQPAIAQLINLLSLYPDFPWRQTMDALRSPSFRQPWLDAQQIDRLDQLSRQRPVVAGIDQWSYALQPSDAGGESLDDDERRPDYLVDQLSAEDLSEIEKGLLAFFNHLTPPSTATMRAFGIWLQENILGPFPQEQASGEEQDLQNEGNISLEMWNCCAENLQFRERDLQSVVSLTEVVSQMVAASFIYISDSDENLAWEGFRDELFTLLPSTVLPLDPLQGGVTCESIHAARSTIFDYTIVLGMSEGEFPRPPGADCLYAPMEREHHPLPIVRYHPAEDACLWWQVVSNSRNKLTLLRPYLDENGAEWQPSPYWGEVTGSLTGLEVVELPIAESPQIEQAACQDEMLTALAISGVQKIPAAIEKEWQAAVRAAEVMRTRQSWQPGGAFEGYLGSKEILSELRARFGSAHRWSPSRLNSYGNCPFGFFAETVLQLEPREDPIDGLDAMQQGSLLHAILESLHRYAAQQGWQFTRDNQEILLQRLEAICKQVFRHAPERFAFRPSALWRHEQNELLRLLRTLVVWECETNGDQARFRPYLQEVRFGFSGSRLPSLQLEGGDGQPYRVAGVIDRVDIDSQGNLQVIDYKSGSLGFTKKDLQNGLAFQTAIYALAVEPLLSDSARVIESAYLHIPKREKSGVLKFNAAVSQDALVQGILDLAVEFIERIQRGEFPSQPGKSAWGASACQRWCSFSSLCRVSRVSIAKARLRREM